MRQSQPILQVAQKVPPVTVESVRELVRSYKLQTINPEMTEDEIHGYGQLGYCE